MQLCDYVSAATRYLNPGAAPHDDVLIALSQMAEARIPESNAAALLQAMGQIQPDQKITLLDGRAYQGIYDPLIDPAQKPIDFLYNGGLTGFPVGEPLGYFLIDMGHHGLAAVRPEQLFWIKHQHERYFIVPSDSKCL